MQIQRSIKDIVTAINLLEDSVKETTDQELKQQYWNRRYALLWLVGQYKDIL